jgi:hypothetical protein
LQDINFTVFVASLPSEIAKSTEPLPEGLAEDVLAVLKTERLELVGILSDLQSAQPSSQQSAPSSRFALAPLTY